MGTEQSQAAPRPVRTTARASFVGRSASEQVKLMLMQGIDDEIVRKFKNLVSASNELGIQLDRLSRIRHGHCDRFSIEWLVGTAYRLDVPIVLKVGE